MRLAAAVCAFLIGIPAMAADMPEALSGWAVHRTGDDYATLIEKTEAAVGESPMGVVFKASPTVAAKNNLDVELPGNMVIGVYGPQFAVRSLRASVPAQVEPPLRLYVTENEDGTATLSYKLPSVVFAAYPDGGPALAELAEELDGILAGIAENAVSR